MSIDAISFTQFEFELTFQLRFCRHKHSQHGALINPYSKIARKLVIFFAFRLLQQNFNANIHPNDMTETYKIWRKKHTIRWGTFSRYAMLVFRYDLYGNFNQTENRFGKGVPEGPGCRFGTATTHTQSVPTDQCTIRWAYCRVLETNRYTKARWSQKGRIVCAG